jgi:hypothetical protein
MYKIFVEALQSHEGSLASIKMGVLSVFPMAHNLAQNRQRIHIMYEIQVLEEIWKEGKLH